MREVEFEGHTYRIGALSPMRQFHIVRRLAPLISALGDDATPDGASLTVLARQAAPILDAIGRMSDTESEYVIHNALRAVERQVGQGNWARMITNGRQGEPLLMFEDLSMPTMLGLVWNVLEENLSRFFPTATPSSIVAPFPMVAR